MAKHESLSTPETLNSTLGKELAEAWDEMNKIRLAEDEMPHG